MRQIKVISVGSPVTIGDDISAKITGICIEENCRVTYRCVSWDCRTRKNEWLEEFEVTRTDETQVMTIGFKQP